MPWVDVEVLAAKNPASPKEAAQVLEYLTRRARPRFYADENFPPVAVLLLRRMGARVDTVHGKRKTGHPDENHAAHALKHGLILVTCDRDFLDNRRFPLIHCPAIFVFDFGTGSVREIMKAFRCLASAFRMPQFYDKWWKVDARPDCWTEQVRFQDGTTSRSRYRLWRGKLQEWVEGEG